MESVFAGPMGPLLICSLRLVDVSLATLRMLLAVRGQRRIAAGIGLVEVTIWVLAVGQVMQYLHSPAHVLGYAAGFALGTMLGSWIEEQIAFGHAAVRVISEQEGGEIARTLRGEGFGVTEFAGQGRNGAVGVVYAVTRRRELPMVMRQVRRCDPHAFVMVEEPKTIQRGWMFDKRRK